VKALPEGGLQEPVRSPIPKAVPRKQTGETPKRPVRAESRVAEFLSEYGAIDPRTIPKQVWEDVRAGKTLLAAYQSYENKNLKALIEAERKNLENARKTAGSRQSAGDTRAQGEIEHDWYKDD
jgi:hypothetical protein